MGAIGALDGEDAGSAGTEIGETSVIGGGARSEFWGRILATVLGRPLTYHAGGEVGPAFGAARLGRLAATGEEPVAVCTRPATERVVDPDRDLHDSYQDKWRRFRALYPALKDRFAESRA